MRKMLVVATREYHAAVRTRAFLVSIILMPTLMLGGVATQALLRDVEDTRDKVVAVLDRTGGQLAQSLAQAAAERNASAIFDVSTGAQLKPRYVIEQVQPQTATPQGQLQQRFELSERVRRGELLAFVEIGDNVLEQIGSDEPGVIYYSNRAAYLSFQRWMEPVINEVILLGRFHRAGLPVDGAQKLVSRVPVTFRGLATRNEKTGQIEDAPIQSRAIAVGVPAILVMLMFMMVMVGATPLMQGVVEEKAMRIAEVLLASLTPFELMLGKLLGMVGVSLTLAVVYLGGGYWLAHRYGFAEYLPGNLLAFFICFQVLAVLMYGSLFVAIGAACTDVRETQTMLLPVLLVMVFPLFFMGYVIQNPDSALATGLSLFPLATPMLMTLRHGIPPGVPWWQSATGMGMVILATLLCVWVAGRVFRVGILSQGKGASFRDMLRWVIHG